MIGQIADDLCSNVGSYSTAKEGSFTSAIELVKLAQLLPAAIVIDLQLLKENEWQAITQNLINIDIASIADYKSAINSIITVPAPPVPLALKGSKQAEFHVFRSQFDGTDHYAIVVGDCLSAASKACPSGFKKTIDEVRIEESTRRPAVEQRSVHTTYVSSTDPRSRQRGSSIVTSIPVIRLHSSCYTGDLLDSLQCDCRSQLSLAIEYMASSPSNAGMVIYLTQDGRGIGLANKIRTYALQAAGHDTVEANHMLGFEADERSFAMAASILKHFEISRIRLLTNNPDKVKDLEAYGIKVVEVLPLTAEINPYNKNYLQTKKDKLGHSTLN